MKIKLDQLLKVTIAIVLATLILPNIIYAQTKTEVLILGTAHLNQIKGFEKDALISVLDKLNQYEFDVIGIENMSTELLNDIVSRKDSTYTELIEQYGKKRLDLQKKYQEELGITLVEAHKKIDSLIQLDTFTNEDRITLMRYYLAAGDMVSAVLQYNYLEKDTPIEEQLIDVSTLDEIKKQSNSSNEKYALAVKLAGMRNHQKLEYIDNLQDEPLLYANFPEFISEYMSKQELFKHIPDLPLFKTVDSLQTSCIKNKNFLPLYLFLNSDYYKQADYDAQWNLWLTTNFESKTDLSRYALWEMRNLQITANIMKLSAFYPGKRILVIIGSSHKSFLEKYLRQVPDIELLEFE